MTAKHQWAKWLTLLLAIFFIVWNLIRMVNVPITFDEAWTYVSYVRGSYKDILICNPLTANNHIFNSLLTKFFVELFHSNSLFLLRLPNLLAQILYLFFGYRILKKITGNQLWVLIGFVLLNCNPFLFDFWGLCRGYGLAIGFMITSGYFFLRYLDDDKTTSLFLSLIIMILGVFTNFSVLNVYISFIGVILFRTIFFRQEWQKQYFLKELAAIIICSSLLYIMVVQPIVELREAEQFYFGGEKGFVVDTIGSLLKESSFSKEINRAILIGSYTVVILITLAGIYTAIKIRKVKTDKTLQRHALLWLLLVLPALSTIVQHWLFGTLFLIERTALFFYPLFILQTVTFFISLKGKPKYFTGVVTILPAAAILNFGMHLNTTYARSWEYDRYDELIADRMTSETDARPVKAKVYWMFMPSLSYYGLSSYPLSLNAGNVGKDVNAIFGLKSYDASEYDYYYIHRDAIADVPANYTVDTSFADGKYILFKKK